MKSNNQKPNTQRIIVSFIGLLCVAATSSLLSSCAYTETINQREAESLKLQQELGQELERGRRLTQ